MPKRKKTGTENVEAVVGRRLLKKTRANYDCQVKLCTNVDVDSEGEVEVAKRVTNEDSIKYKAVSTTGEYRSAITALCKEHHMSYLLSRDELSEFLCGYM